MPLGPDVLGPAEPLMRVDAVVLGLGDAIRGARVTPGGVMVLRGLLRHFRTP